MGTVMCELTQRMLVVTISSFFTNMNQVPLPSPRLSLLSIYFFFPICNRAAQRNSESNRNKPVLQTVCSYSPLGLVLPPAPEIGGSRLGFYSHFLCFTTLPGRYLAGPTCLQVEFAKQASVTGQSQAWPQIAGSRGGRASGRRLCLRWAPASASGHPALGE